MQYETLHNNSDRLGAALVCPRGGPPPRWKFRWRKRNSLTEMIMPKLSVGCFAVFETQDTLKMVYHFYFHSITNYRIIFWGNSSYSNSIFKLQNSINRIIMGADNRDSCTEFLKHEIFYH